MNDRLAVLADGTKAVVLAPVGFVTDHVEVLWDLDVVAAATAEKLGISLTRTVTPGTVPDDRFVAMWMELLRERFEPGTARRGMGGMGVRPDVCPPAAACRWPTETADLGVHCPRQSGLAVMTYAHDVRRNNPEMTTAPDRRAGCARNHSR